MNNILQHRKFIFFIKALDYLAIAVLTALIFSCGSGSVNHAPTITGLPPKELPVGIEYIFTPTVNDADEDKLSFSIQNKPSWAQFDPKSGTLTGKPNETGKYENIVISVSDGKIEAVLNKFNILVTSEGSSSDITYISASSSISPFIYNLELGGRSLANLNSIQFTITPKIGSTAKAIRANYPVRVLTHRNYLDIPNQKLSLPVFGLYQDYNNQVSLHLVFNDMSSQDISVTIPTSSYLDPNHIYDQLTFIKRRSTNSSLGFSFFAMKNKFGTPVIVDTDGEMRWIGPGNTISNSSIFVNNGFLVGVTNSSAIQETSLDGRTNNYSISSSENLRFHHNIDIGKLGYLAHFDTDLGIESTVAEITYFGAVLKKWDLAKILYDYMVSEGDMPADFVRPGIDWFHSNAATYDSRDDSVIVSSRENFLIKIDYETGNIIWIFGDPTKYWYTFPSLRKKAITLESGGLYPIGQHATSITTDGLLMLFNDGAGSFNTPKSAPKGETRNYSAISAYDIDSNSLTAKEVWSFDYEQSIYSDVCSSTYEAPDKSLLITYSTANNRTKARLVGLDIDHNVIFDFEYQGSGCGTAWNSIPINLENIQFEF